jgi:hypothetical protein
MSSARAAAASRGAITTPTTEAEPLVTWAIGSPAVRPALGLTSPTGMPVIVNRCRCRTVRLGAA